jgi:hypothetical protein
MPNRCINVISVESKTGFFSQALPTSNATSHALRQLHSDLSAALQHELRHQQQQQQELLFCRSERDSAREESAASAKDVMSLRALLQVAELRQTERETASKERLVDSFENERRKLDASLSDKVSDVFFDAFQLELSCSFYLPSLHLFHCIIQVAECNRLNERLAIAQQQLADLQAEREVDTLEMETRQARDLSSLSSAAIHPAPSGE